MTTSSSLYGQSLYDLAAEEGLSGQILQEMETVDGLFHENPDYLTLLSEPSIPRGERLGLLREAFGEAVHPYLLNYLMILLENNLLRGYSASLRTYRSAYYKDNGIAEVTVTAAVRLSDAQEEALKARLEALSGKTVLLKQKIDTGILGGLRVEIDGRLLDGTVMGRLADLRKKVSDTVL